MLVILPSIVCGALILAGCVAVSQVLEASALPVRIRVAWIVAIVVSPVLAPLLWSRVWQKRHQMAFAHRPEALTRDEVSSA